jgi:hypothetical protein
MNTLLLISAIISAGATAGHFSLGYLMYVKPMLNSELDKIPKYVMLSVYHFMSVYMVMSTICLLLAAFGVISNGQMLLKLFIRFSYILMAVAQILVAAISKIPNGALKMFQWMLFLAAGIFALFGTVLLPSLTTG